MPGNPKPLIACLKTPSHPDPHQTECHAIPSQFWLTNNQPLSGTPIQTKSPPNHPAPPRVVLTKHDIKNFLNLDKNQPCG